VQEVCEVGFSDNNEFIILPKSSIAELIHTIQNTGACSADVELENIIPIDYVNYIIRVININRGYHKKFAYSYLRQGEITNEEIASILKRQLGFLTVDNIQCFTEVVLTNSDKASCYTLKFNPIAHVVLSTTGLNIAIKDYNE